MLKKLILIAAITLFPVLSFAQDENKTDAENDKLRGAVAKVTTKKYEYERGKLKSELLRISTVNYRRSGNKLNSSAYDAEEKALSKEAYEYDSQGKLVKEKSADMPVTYSSTFREVLYKYNAVGKRIEEEHFTNGEASFKSQMTYNEQGKLIKEFIDFYGKEPSDQTYSYDSKGRLASLVIRNGEKLSNQTDYEYNAEGYKSTYTRFDEQEKANGSVVEIFNSSNEPLTKTYLDKDGEISEQLTHTANAKGRAGYYKSYSNGYVDYEWFTQHDLKGNETKSTKYTYDCEKIVRQLADHTDLLQVTIGPAPIPQKKCAAPSVKNLKDRHIYQLIYDKNGNWISKIERVQVNENQKPVLFTLTRRTIVYYAPAKAYKK